jgi:MYXO-CTERM domain-containing protein
MKRSIGSRLLFACALGSAWVPGLARASECDDPKPAWLLCEDFEQGALGWDDWYAQSSWVECAGCSGGTNDPDRIRLEQDAAIAHGGSWTVHMPGTAPPHQGGTLRFATCAGEQQAGCTLEGHDQLYFRTWVRLAAEHEYVHHFLGIGGSRPNAYWDANGNAGCRPNGERWAGTRVDMNTSHELFFYTYYPGMHCDSGGYCSGSYAEQICNGCADKDMPCSNGLECCWGNHFSPEQPVVVPTEEWTCIEMMMELNTPGASDGSMAFWVDDVLAHEVTGMHWRDVPELQLNRAMLEHYIESADAPNPIWFDDVVVSTERIGCEASVGTGDDTGGSGDGDTGPDDDTTGGSGSGPGGVTASDDTGATAAGTSSDGGDSAGSPSDGDDAGCGCRATGNPGVGLAWSLLVFLPWLRRRRALGARAAWGIGSFLAAGCASDGDTGSGVQATDDATSVADASDTGATQASDHDGSDGDTGSTGAPQAESSSSETGSTGEPTCSEYLPWFYEGFEDHEVEESLSGGNPFGAAGRTRATDVVAHTGSRSAKMEIRPEDGGGFGQWGGTLKLPDLTTGQSVWVRLWIWWPAAFEFSASPWMKFIRIHNRTAEGGNGGYNDLYVDNADGETSVLRVIKEVHNVWETYDGPPLPRDTWERYEMQIIADHVSVDDGGQARFRVWRDDELIFDRTDVPTLTDVGGTLDYVYLFTYWNNEMPPANTVYIDDLSIALDDAPPPNVDAHGNPYLGPWVPCAE